MPSNMWKHGASDYESEGRRFESCRARHKNGQFADNSEVEPNGAEELNKGRVPETEHVGGVGRHPKARLVLLPLRCKAVIHETAQKALHGAPDLVPRRLRVFGGGHEKRRLK
jgi:hypothetical protein